jgi:hypothetical protein
MIVGRSTTLTFEDAARLLLKGPTTYYQSLGYWALGKLLKPNETLILPDGRKMQSTPLLLEAIRIHTSITNELLKFFEIVLEIL